MKFATAISELERYWFPHTPDSALARVINLLELGSPLLIHRAFERCAPMGCLATQIAWHHPQSTEISEAGIYWLSRIVGLNPGTSEVIRAWDDHGIADWTLRMELLEAFRNEQKRRQQVATAPLLNRPVNESPSTEPVISSRA